MSQLEPQHTAEVRDLIVSPPTSGKYEKLKAELIKRLSASQERKIKQLIMHEELGDRKPSQFLRHLQHLAGPTVPDDFIRTIWSSRLPHNLQTIVASQAAMGLDDLAELADRIHDIVPNGQVASTSNSPPVTKEFQSSSTEVLTRTVAELGRKLEAMNVELRSRRRQPLVAEHNCLASRLFITDRKTKVQYLIDTDSDLCVFPMSAVQERRIKTTYELFTANGTIIATYR
ncbi:uncharacterized protein LOC124542578 [Vanessa cardui]|uniref:uncharacterized protein LOC124542578 n=1 Tax=Vanessa cardui TaxID=171605 RepID=UPI001F128EDA|nr:uncharacterized protein LOC124542578 [Vanessa cardui]